MACKMTHTICVINLEGSPWRRVWLACLPILRQALPRAPLVRWVLHASNGCLARGRPEERRNNHFLIDLFGAASDRHLSTCSSRGTVMAGNIWSFSYFFYIPLFLTFRCVHMPLCVKQWFRKHWAHSRRRLMDQIVWLFFEWKTESTGRSLSILHALG